MEGDGGGRWWMVVRKEERTRSDFHQSHSFLPSCYLAHMDWAMITHMLLTGCLDFGNLCLLFLDLNLKLLILLSEDTEEYRRIQMNTEEYRGIEKNTEE